MNKRILWAGLAILTGLAILLSGKGFWGNKKSSVEARLISPVSQLNDFSGTGISGAAAGFARADRPQALSFPRDFGPHLDYQTEWWYTTGNLDAPDGRHFGYQLTFFRRALLTLDEWSNRPSDWATDQVYLAHLALSDVSAGKHIDFERFERGALGLAGAQASPYRVWLDEWSVAEISPGKYHLQAAQDGLSLDLRLTDQKGPILQGDQGYSQKGPDPGEASYYYSQTHLDTQGSLKVDGETFSVKGLSWTDHEFSTSALALNQVGWDWFSIQLDNDNELMVFQIRQADGSIDPFSSGTLVAPDGSTRHLGRQEFQINVQSTWRSPHTGAEYPSGWTVQVPSADLTLNIQPYLTDQEMNLSFTYWEGAVRINGSQSGSAVSGAGYVELTGYSSQR